MAGDGNSRWYLRGCCIEIFLYAMTFDWWSCPEMPDRAWLFNDWLT